MTNGSEGALFIERLRVTENHNTWLGFEGTVRLATERRSLEGAIVCEESLLYEQRKEEKLKIKRRKES